VDMVTISSPTSSGYLNGTPGPRGQPADEANGQVRVDGSTDERGVSNSRQ
jgi:hypothetical protein